MAKVTGTFRTRWTIPTVGISKSSVQLPKLTGANIKSPSLSGKAGKTGLTRSLAAGATRSGSAKKTTAGKVCRTVVDVANVAVAAADFGKVVYRYANGNINKAECAEQLGKKGAVYASSFAASKTGAVLGGAVGSALGSAVPGVGTAVGLTVGAVAGEIIGDVVGYKAGDEIGRAVTKAVKSKKS